MGQHRTGDTATPIGVIAVLAVAAARDREMGLHSGRNRGGAISSCDHSGTVASDSAVALFVNCVDGRLSHA